MGTVLEVVLSSPPLGVREDPDLGLDKVVDPTIVHSMVIPVGASLGPLTTPPVTQVWSDRIALVAGVFTLDLQALVGSSLPAVDLTGLSLQIVQISTPEANGNPIFVAPGAVNGYDLMTPSMLIALSPGDFNLMVLNGSQAAVGASDSEIDFTGSGVDEFDILIAAG